MTISPSDRRLLPWVGAILLSVVVAFVAIEATRIVLEYSYKDVLATEVKRRALEVTGRTLNGNVMGSVINLGLVNQAMKSVARGEVALLDPVVMNTLQAVGKLYQASGVFVINKDGIVQSSWDSGGKTSSGLDVKFRPYFQIAMQGKINVYAAISLATGQRALYFASPLYSEVSSSSPVIGAMAARLDLDRIDSVLKAWPGPALLFSPQEIVFASNLDEWVTHLSGERTPEQLQEIRALKQFGNAFDKGTPKILPFDIKNEIVNFNSRRYAVAKSPVQWNDLHGEWSLTLLGDLDALMPTARRIKIGVASGALTMTLGTLLLFWLRRLKNANEDRERAEAELKEHAKKLEIDSRIKLNLAEISVELQQAESLADFARKFMFHFMDRISAEYGVFYSLDEEKELLTPLGGYGVVADELASIPFGQGLVGQCAQNKTPIEISNSAESTVRILWGAGELTPQSIMLLPLIEQSGQLLGVIVMASLHAMDAEKRLFLDALLPMVAMNLAIQQSNLSTKYLLETSREQAEKLETQQSELLASSLKREEANRALMSQVGELAQARNAMMNIMEDLEISRKDTEERNAKTQLLLEETSRQSDKLQLQRDEIIETERWYREIIESAPDGMLLVDEQGVIISTNGTFDSMFGYAKGELQGQSVEILVSDAIRDKHVALREGFMKEGSSREIKKDADFRGSRKDGSEFPVEIGLSILPAMGSRARCVCASVRDITERKGMEESLKQQMDELERFNRLTINREDKMIHLKEEINTLLEQTGKEKKYKIVE